MKRLPLTAVLLCTFALASCYSLEHQVGDGHGPEARTYEARQWYALWGLVEIGEVDTRAMAGNALDYTIKTEHGLVDLMLNMLTGFGLFSSKSVQVLR